MALPKSVLLIITGSVAAYKSLELIRLLRSPPSFPPASGGDERGGVVVNAVLTKGGAQFITALAVSSLTGTKTYDNLFSLTDEIEMGHIELSRSADVILVAPASADIIAKMAAGIADDLATTALLATNKPVIIAPAMNHRMWHHPATQRNLAQLAADGVQIIPPTLGDMACGEHGIGRLAEPSAMVDFLSHAFSAGDSLKGKHAIVTSGPTTEAVDPVRYLGNRSSGKQGHAIAQALASAGARVTLITGATQLPDPLGVTTIHITDAASMLAAAERALPADIFVGAAAVADWRPAVTASQKIKKQPSLDTLTLEFIPTVDVLAAIAQHTNRPKLVVGFAAETENLVANARAKRAKKRADWLLANEVGTGEIFGSDENAITFVAESGEEIWPRQSKHAIAGKLVQKIVEHFSKP